MANNSKPRTNAFGAAYAGSQRQIQIYVNQKSVQLSSQVAAAINAQGDAMAPERIEWVSPLAKDSFREYQDAEFLAKVGLGTSVSALQGFWPRGGPVWDALGVVRDPFGVLLVEAKSYPSEIFGNGCQASPPSRRRIDAALAKTKAWLGVPQSTDWTGSLYQSANRLAHLYFLSEIVGVTAWLVNIHFFDDPHSPTTLPEWTSALKQVKAQLGLSGISIPRAIDLFLSA